MASNLTLSSRLRVLVAKAFRAEQLYGSMRQARSIKTEVLGELAHDVRSAVWQRAYAQVRSVLNDLISSCSVPVIAAKVMELKAQGDRRAADASRLVERLNIRLLEAAERHEFAHVLKLALELVEYKAHAQAEQVIADELGEILQQGNRAIGDSVQMSDKRAIAANGDFSPESAAAEFAAKSRSNVIPLKRRVASMTGARGQ